MYIESDFLSCGVTSVTWGVRGAGVSDLTAWIHPQKLGIYPTEIDSMPVETTPLFHHAKNTPKGTKVCVKATPTFFCFTRGGRSRRSRSRGVGLGGGVLASLTDVILLAIKHRSLIIPLFQAYFANTARLDQQR